MFIRRDQENNITAQLGTVLRALKLLNPQNDATRLKIFQHLGYISKEPEPEEEVPILQTDQVIEEEETEHFKKERNNINLASTSDNPPSIISSQLEPLDEEGADPPEWLTITPLIPVPDIASDPFSEPLPPLFAPNWNRALISRATARLSPSEELDLDSVFNQIVCAEPITSVPHLSFLSHLQGVQLLVDTGEAMEPFRGDVRKLIYDIYGTVGRDRIELLQFQGCPLWGVTTHPLSEYQTYYPPAAGKPVLILSDLGIGGHQVSTTRADIATWCEFASLLSRATTSATVILPHSEDRWPSEIPSNIQLVTWDRTTTVTKMGYQRGIPEINEVIISNTTAIRPEFFHTSTDVVELAMLASIAARIEPQLLRTIRLELAPHLNVSTETDLWFSDLVQEHAPTGIVLVHDVALLLQRRLVQIPSMLDATYKVIKRLHARAAPVLQAEEAIAYHTLKGDMKKVQDLLRSLVATLITPGRDGVAEWAGRALRRLPSEVRHMEEAQMLSVGTSMRLSEIEAYEQNEKKSNNRGWHWLKPETGETEAALNLREGVVEFGPTAMKSAHKIRLPIMSPVIIEFSWWEENEGRVERVHKIYPGRRMLVPVGSDTVELKVLGGAHYQLAPKTQTQFSSQKFIARNRAPRVQIKYGIHSYGAEKEIQLPFVMGVMADLSGKQLLVPVFKRKFLDIDVDNFDSRMKAIQPRVAYQVPNTLNGEGNLSIDITFENMNDFSPAAVVRRVDGLKKLFEERQQLSNLMTLMDGKGGAEDLIAKILQDNALLQSLAESKKTTSPENKILSEKETSEKKQIKVQRQDLQTESDVTEDNLSNLLKKEFKPRTDKDKSFVEQAVKLLAQQALEQTLLISDDPLKSLDAIIAELDRRLSEQVNLIIHHPNFQELEGTWQGLRYLVNNTETDEMLKIRFIDITKLELSKTFKKFKGAAWDQSPIFKLIYKQEYDIFGGEPYGCLMGDYYFDHSHADVELLGEMSKISAAAHVPFIVGASPSPMQMESWQELANPRDMTKIFTGFEYTSWRSLRESEDSRYLGLAMPRYLARLPYGAKTLPVEEFNFEEDIHADHSKYTWSNAAYAMAVNINRSFKLYNWCSRIRGIESGGSVEGISTYTFPTDDGGVDMKCPTEIAISDRREAELAKKGLMPLLHRKNSDFAAFISAQSLQKPFEYDDSDAAANAYLSARLPYLFACCRFAHYLKCIVRDKIGLFKERADMQAWLQKWIMNYVDSDPVHSSETTKAQKPLAAAEVVVEEVEGNSDYYISKIYLKPHYQLEGLTTSLRMVTKLHRFKDPIA